VKSDAEIRYKYIYILCIKYCFEVNIYKRENIENLYADIAQFESKQNTHTYSSNKLYTKLNISNNNNNNSILYLFTCGAQQPMANYRVSTNTYSNKVTHDKNTTKRTTKQT
jgi:hypothetical protein